MPMSEITLKKAERRSYCRRIRWYGITDSNPGR